MSLTTLASRILALSSATFFSCASLAAFFFARRSTSSALRTGLPSLPSVTSVELTGSSAASASSSCIADFISVPSEIVPIMSCRPPPRRQPLPVSEKGGEGRDLESGPAKELREERLGVDHLVLARAVALALAKLIVRVPAGAPESQHRSVILKVATNAPEALVGERGVGDRNVLELVAGRGVVRVLVRVELDRLLEPERGASVQPFWDKGRGRGGGAARVVGKPS